MKILKHRNIMGCLYALLLAMPFIAIGVRCAYVSLNKNAYQSAEITNTTYQPSPKYTQGDINNGLEVGKIYHFTFDNNVPSDLFATENDFLEFSIVNGNFTNYIADNTYLDETYIDNSDYIIYSLEATETMSIHITKNGILTSIYIEGISELSFELDILVLDYYNVASLGFFSNTTYQDYNYIEVESTTLDNVFEYSVNKFIEDNNFGKVDFFQWTTDIFFDSNQVNNMYVHYINWYFNYALLMSMTYILFLVLMWFVNFARRLLERGMNYDF